MLAAGGVVAGGGVVSVGVPSVVLGSGSAGADEAAGVWVAFGVATVSGEVVVLSAGVVGVVGGAAGTGSEGAPGAPAAGGGAAGARIGADGAIGAWAFAGALGGGGAFTALAAVEESPREPGSRLPGWAARAPGCAEPVMLGRGSPPRGAMRA